ncbi:hypothetical protein Pgin02_01343 [Porphyromonas gingivalis]
MEVEFICYGFQSQVQHCCKYIIFSGKNRLPSITVSSATLLQIYLLVDTPMV